MNVPWWRRTGDDGPDGGGAAARPVDTFPELLPADARAFRAAVQGRIGSFTPDWRPGPGDAGIALVKVFSQQAAPVAERTNRLRDKYAREELRIAGIRGRGSRPGSVLVVLTLQENAPETVPVPAGTQLTAASADGSGQVVFETARDLWATPSRLAMLVTQAGGSPARVDPTGVTPSAPLLALGRRPRPGYGLWLGLRGPVPYPRLTLGVDLAGDDGPQPVVAGAEVLGQVGEPALSLELLTRDGLVPAELHADGTRALRQSGVLEVGTARNWPALPHPGLADPPSESELRWLRIGLLFGSYPAPPRITAIRINAVAAEGAETIRDDVLEPVAEPVASTPIRRFRLSRTPVLRGTVRLEVDAPDPADLFDIGPTRPAQPQQWVEVPTLARSRPYDQHFVVDEATGVVTFGDGVHGARVPAGLRHIRATSYRTGGGRATAVPAGAGFVPRQTIAFLGAIDNPAPAAGAADGEPAEDLVDRGPALLRARDRAVTPPDLEALAVAASGDVGRVIAVPGADLDGTSRPGRLTVVVVGTRRDDGGAPEPTEETLAAVARFLGGSDRPIAPVGIGVVVTAARFVPVELEITLRPDDDADRGAVTQAVVGAVDRHLDALVGGEEGRGWPLGAPLGWRRLVSVVAAVSGVASVGRVGMTVAGRPSGRCQDAPLPAGTLPWPGHHLVLPIELGEPW
jgi:predicted phage baseplate assembly protein